ncbi:MAG: Outer rane lipoproteinsorting protein-like protein [Acidimicrobiales bacterium]|nr:Outer rane lipoproteinsorting protein-like protein [Acidimicrobiales bacterium]
MNVRGGWFRAGAPFVVVASVAGILAAHRAATDPGPPTVPARPVAEVVTLATRPHHEPRSGSFHLTTHLGLPDLGSTAPGGGSATSSIGLAAGENRARVWSDGQRRSRIALLQPLAETDWVRDGTKTWVWRSVGERATKVAAPTVQAPGIVGALTAGSTVQTPDDLAGHVLALRDAATKLRLLSPTRVAGRAAHQLELTPGVRGSLVERVVVAVDAATGLPLRVSVFARGVGRPVIDDGFTAISFGWPDPSNLTFTPPKTAEALDVSTPALLLKAQAERARRFEREGFGRRGDRRGGFPGPPIGGAPAAPIGVTGTGWTQVFSTTDVRFWQLQDLANRGTAVHGRFGTGHLVRTPLVSLLVLDDGRVAVGAVTPDVLEQAMRR